MSRKEQVLRQKEISCKALVRALDCIEKDIFMLRFVPKRNAFSKYSECTSQIISRWDSPDTEVPFEFAARKLRRTLFERIKGSVQIYTEESRFLFSVPGISFGTFRDTAIKHSHVMCPMDPEHDMYFDSMINEKKPIKKLPFHIIISTNGDNIATLRDLREKALKKL